MKFGLLHRSFLGALCGLTLVSCGRADRPNPTRAEAAPRAVRVARAEVRPMERVLHVVGTLFARDEATVAAEVAGKIEQSHVDLGDQVHAGQVLALIDFTAYEALVRQSAANLARASASAANAAQNLKRIRDLQRDKISSASELDQAVAEDRQRRAEVKAAEAAHAIAQLNLERSRVKAPFDGAVAQRVASVGDYVAVGAPILRLVKTSPLRLRLDVPERQALAVRAGQSVRVSAEGDANRYTGRIARVAPAIREADRMLVVEADIPNDDGRLRAGLFARAQIVVDEHEEGVSVPANALVTFAGLEKVVVIQDGRAAEKTVTTGRRGADWIEIVSGLGAGETVVLDPAGIRTGQPLVAADAAATPPASQVKMEAGR
jgi:RND family efflux transporter MFP subunit